MQEPQLYTKEWCENGVVAIMMGSKELFAFGFGCEKTKDELMKLGDIVVELLEKDFESSWKCVEQWVKEDCGEWANGNRFRLSIRLESVKPI